MKKQELIANLFFFSLLLVSFSPHSLAQSGPPVVPILLDQPAQCEAPLYGMVYNNPPGGDYPDSDLLNAGDMHNVHIHGFGQDLDNPYARTYPRLDYARQLGVPNLVLTLSHAPARFKDCSKTPEGQNCNWWAEAPLVDEVGYFNATKPIIQKAIEEHGVTHIFVGNEMKGFWDKDNNTWDGVKYTRFYNLVWNYVKSDLGHCAVKIGGPYTPFRRRCHASTEVEFAGVLLDRRDLEVTDYWFANKDGADFFTYDGGIGGRCAADGIASGWWGYQETLMITQAFRQRYNLPVYLAEAYSTGAVRGTFEAGGSAALLWAQSSFWPSLPAFDTSTYCTNQ